MKVDIKTIARWVAYGILFAGSLYCLYRVVDSFGTQYTEPEVIQTEQT